MFFRSSVRFSISVIAASVFFPDNPKQKVAYKKDYEYPTYVTRFYVLTLSIRSAYNIFRNFFQNVTLLLEGIVYHIFHINADTFDAAIE